MTNLEKYNNILKRNLQVADEDLNDDVLVYNRYKKMGIRAPCRYGG